MKGVDCMNDNEKFIQEMYASSLERTIKRLWITTILLIVLLVGSNICWIVYENSFEETVVTQDVDTGNGDANVSGTGDVYGTSETDNKN